MNSYYHDRMCPNCKTWNSLIGEWPKTVQNSPDVWHDKTQCRKCDYVTVWNMAGSMLPYVADCYPSKEDLDFGDNNDSISTINS
jgi:hypothetical protein